jgi:hypothetical protein
MIMTKKERREFNKCFDEILKLCDVMDEILNRMDVEPEPLTTDGPKVIISKEHYA